MAVVSRTFNGLGQRPHPGAWQRPDNQPLESPQPLATGTRYQASSRTLVFLLCAAVFATFLAARSPMRSMWARGDMAPLWPTPQRLRFDLFTWDLAAGGAGGGPAIWLSYTFVGALWQLGYALGLDTAAMQAIGEAAYHAGAAAGAAYLGSRLFPGRRALPAVAGLLYTFSFDWITNSPTAVLCLRVLVPLALALYLDCCRAIGRGRYRTAQRIGLALAVAIAVGASYAAINLPQLIVAGAGGMIFAGCCLVAQGLCARALIATAALLVLTILASSWWLPVVASYYLSSALVPGAAIGTSIDVTQWSWTHARDSLLNLFSLNPYWGWRPEYSPFYSVYDQWWLRSSMVVPATLALSAVLLARGRPERLIVLAGSLALAVLLFLSNGLHEPWSGVNLWFYRHLPGLWLLREPYSKLSIFVTLLVALLAAYAVDELGQRLRARWSKVISSLLLAALILASTIPAFPLFFSRLMQAGTTLMPDGYVQIPHYWFDLAGYLARRPDQRVLLLPSNRFYAVPYTWGLYSAEFLPDRLAPVATVRRLFDYLDLSAGYSRQVEELYRQLEQPPEGQPDPAAVRELLQRLGIERLLIRNDLADPNARPLGSPVPDPRLDGLRERLLALGLVPEASFSALDLYRVPEGWARPRVFAAASIPLGGEEVPAPATSDGASQEVGPRSLQVMLRTPAGAEVSAPAAAPDRVFYQILNPAAYRVRIEGARGPVLLVLQESFHPLWKARLLSKPCCGAWWAGSSEAARDFAAAGARELPPLSLFLPRDVLTTWLSPSVPERDHLIADGYANAWLIDRHGDYEVLLEYLPQRGFYLGLLATATGLLAMAAVAFWGSAGAVIPAAWRAIRAIGWPQKPIVFFLCTLLVHALLVAAAQQPPGVVATVGALGTAGTSIALVLQLCLMI